jgi:hypothetical protein
MGRWPARRFSLRLALQHIATPQILGLTRGADSVRRRSLPGVGASLATPPPKAMSIYGCGTPRRGGCGDTDRILLEAAFSTHAGGRCRADGEMQ